MGAVINSFLGEDLSNTAWLSIIALTILGILFFIFGTLKNLIKNINYTFLN
jgi:hypothetical protein